MTSPEKEPTDATHTVTGADGLNALDRERADSLADEGGTAAALVEAHESVPRAQSLRFEEGSWRTAAIVTIGTAIAWLVLRSH